VNVKLVSAVCCHLICKVISYLISVSLIHSHRQSQLSHCILWHCLATWRNAERWRNKLRFQLLFIFLCPLWPKIHFWSINFVYIHTMQSYFHFVVSIFPTTKRALSLTAGGIYIWRRSQRRLARLWIDCIEFLCCTAFCILVYSSTNCHHSRTAIPKFEANVSGTWRHNTRQFKSRS
jgi:hypothetical protein